ncbi:cytochrome b [Pseudoxanthomonas sp.]|uniref:cytochrome b n=1 Tax=Pseudoxanthomonas sp. TaxID=1871049 RepID=UPI00261513BB|nr:cytochrome b [Pseudoxanthomonas sp.]WDS37002.1 MAG: cytochrome b [Pseudoxanthomonas sp.]
MQTHRYRSSQVFLHWATFLLVAVLVSLPYADEFYRSMLGSRRNVMTLHKSLGILVLLLTVARLLVRWRTPRPAQANVPLDHAARAGHYLLYAVLLAMPVSGLVFNSKPLDLFWLVQLPPLPVSEDARQLARQFHLVAQYLFLALVAGHAGFALWHHYVRKERVLATMSFGGARQ